MTRTDDSRLATIRSLLAKAESTPYSEEAEAFTAKATALMARYSIDQALLWAADTAQHAEPVERRLVVHRPFTAQKAVLVNQVATALRCRAVRLGREPGAPQEWISIVGFADDVDLVEELVTSLLVQMATAMNGAEPAMRQRPSDTASWRRSFMMGFIDVISHRLVEQQRDALADAERERTRPGAAARSATSTALVLAERDDRVEAATRARFPRLRTSRVGGGSSSHGRRAGTSAGHAADLGGRRLPPRRELGQRSG
ncbi:MAG: DUF2786 domain-containing protein [Microthrixaceae bacterium]|jgi:hypothetical protein